MYARLLFFHKPEKQSIFLWGARQTGKSSFLKKTFPKSVMFDLLDLHLFSKFTKAPHLLREEVLALSKQVRKHPIIIDEVQKIPELLNEVHWLIENANASFILCGSSARQLKIKSTNLLGGRAWQYNFYPLVSKEIPDFNLLKALQNGLIPNHYLSEKKYVAEYLRAYVEVYLRDEIRNEGLVRNLSGFARFLDVIGLTNGEMINYSNIARDCGIERHTVQGFYQILEDTLLGYFVYPYKKKAKRDIISAAPKFYLFDVGVANYLAERSINALKGEAAGRSFEHFILMELMAYRGLSRQTFDICYWRTKAGLEVDFILGKADVAIEVKISKQVRKNDLKGIIAFCEEYSHTQAIVVSLDDKPRLLDVGDISISIMPYNQFLKELWGNKLFNFKKYLEV